MALAGRDDPAPTAAAAPPRPVVLLALLPGADGSGIADLRAAGWTLRHCGPPTAAPAGVPVIAGPSRAAALGAALAWAGAAGHARALVIGGSQVPSPAALAQLVAQDLPGGVVLGCRAAGWRHPGRVLAALGVWCAAGHWVRDPGAPVRIVPTTLRIPGGPGRSWEVMSVVRAAWQALPLALRPWPEDAVAVPWSRRLAWHGGAAWALLWLVARRAWPFGRGPGDRQLLRALLASHRSPGRLAAAAALGMGLAVAPLPGLQMALTTMTALALRLNVPLALACSNVSLGPLLVCYYAIATAIGLHLREHQPFWATCARLRQELAAHDVAAAWHGPLRACLEAWLLGSALLMLCFAAIGAIVGYALGWWLARGRG